MIIRARAPLRLGLAGGGTDVSPYSDLYGGAVLNATISMYAYATIKPRDDGKIILNAIDRNQRIILDARDYLEINGELDLLKGVYNRIVKDFVKKPLSFELTTYVDAPPGSGLGSSSTLVVAILGAFAEWLSLPLGEYDIAHIAFEIERKDLEMTGGKQDQYAATFGGFNFMEFYDNDKVIVNPLRIKPEIINELQFNLLLYYTGTSRLSSKIIEAQVKNVSEKKERSVEAMHKLKEQAIMMKEAILKGKLDEIGEILDFGWQYKKQMAEGITNPVIEEIYEAAKRAGSTGGKISGAGGGGFMILYCPRNTRYKVIESLQKFGGEFRRYQFTKYGVETWKV
ncbi:MAG: dehydrogenase [Candidatus Woesearchaeota archaeon]|nr:MAG: dehydrogenase [Candidatus Woesearchaeota archaeon]